MTAAWVAAVLGGAMLIAACGGAGDLERSADLAYGEQRYQDALAEYRGLLGGKPAARIWAKTAAAALHAGDLSEAADAYLRLAGEDPTRSEEAAEGLESVARAADREGNTPVLERAVQGLQTISPDRVKGRYALVLAREPGMDQGELAELLPGAIAAAGSSRAIDSLLTVYGAALRQTSGCGQALLPFRAALRRAEDSVSRRRARRGVAECAFTLGQRAAGAGNQNDAALWFSEASRVDSTSATGRQALLRYGEIRAAQGDTVTAAVAFQAAATASPPDSISQVAEARLAAVGFSRAPADTARQANR
jgi:tetratricopeptide (TPR) repeat protein